MKEKRDTCWYDFNTTPKKMLEGARGKLWPVLEKSDHFPILDELVNVMLKQCSNCTSLAEVGCGAADFQRVFTNFFYTGVDLPHIIDRVAKVHMPMGRYIKADIYKSDVKFLKEYDVVLMNAFIDVMEYPLIALAKVLKNSKKYVILHRQRLTQDKTHVVRNSSYGGQTFQSVINYFDFVEVLGAAGFGIAKECRFPWEGNTFSWLLRKK
jgi:hypothetical protein